MAQVLARSTRIPRLGRFGWLMALYAENHRKLVRLLAPGDLAVGAYVSSIGDGLDLRLDVLEQHRFTSELRMTYAMLDAVTGAPDPTAFVRLYRDAHQSIGALLLVIEHSTPTMVRHESGTHENIGCVVTDPYRAGSARRF